MNLSMEAELAIARIPDALNGMACALELLAGVLAIVARTHPDLVKGSKNDEDMLYEVARRAWKIVG